MPDSGSASLSDAVLRPVREGNTFESTFGHLAMAIRLGVFAEGERLPAERELAERLGVGRATLREAIGALRECGLVDTRRGRSGGTVVLYRGDPDPNSSAGGPGAAPNRAWIRYSPAEVADVLGFRAVVEPGAAQLAASSDHSADQRAWLRAVLRATASATDGAAQRVADSRLHLAIASLSGSAMLVEAVTHTHSILVELLAAVPLLSAGIAHSQDQHTEIVEAVLNGEHLRARAVMEEHCQATSVLLKALLG